MVGDDDHAGNEQAAFALAASANPKQQKALLTETAYLGFDLSHEFIPEEKEG